MCIRDRFYDAVLSWALERLDTDQVTREQYLLELAAPLPGSYSPKDDRRVAEEEMAIFRGARKTLGI